MVQILYLYLFVSVALLYHLKSAIRILPAVLYSLMIPLATHYFLCFTNEVHFSISVKHDNGISWWCHCFCTVLFLV
jgi:hypothetical protein